ncbi:MAG: hypothetical protein ACXVB0_07065 [Mucilaginibacter sp.]
MKKLYFGLFVLLVFASCKKNDMSADSGCISRINRQNFGVSASDSTAAVQLLQQNHLPTNDLAFEYIRLHDTVTTSGSTKIYQYIFAVNYLNGLPVLSYDFGYTFKNGIFQETTGAHYSGTVLDTHPTQSLPRLRQLFIGQVNKNGSVAIFKDSCLVAEFGYYDLNVDYNVPTNDHTANFIKAWLVKPKQTPYPQALFRDDNGQLISYVAGLIEY